MGLKGVAKAVLPQSLRTRLMAWRERFTGEPELALLPALCDRSRVAVDAGANRGYFAYFLSLYSARCHAFEPNPHYAARLQADLGGRVTVHAMALSDHEGEAVLRIPQDGALQGMATVEADNRLADMPTLEVTVPLRRLDGLGLPPVGFVKIDVEGHERAVLAGAAGILERDHPRLLVEIEERHKPGSLEAVRALLAPHGYRGYYLQAGRLRPLERFDAARDQDPARLTRHGGQAGAGYVNNFLFVADAEVLARLPKVAA